MQDGVLLSEAAERMHAEWEARCGDPLVWGVVLQAHGELGHPFPDDSSSADPGKWPTRPRPLLCAVMGTPRISAGLVNSVCCSPRSCLLQAPQPESLPGQLQLVASMSPAGNGSMLAC